MIAALLVLGLKARESKEAAVADLQGPNRGSHLGQGGGTVGSASILQRGQLQASTEGIIAQMPFAGRESCFWTAATAALEQPGQFIRQPDAGAIFQVHLGEAPQQGDSDG